VAVKNPTILNLFEGLSLVLLIVINIFIWVAVAQVLEECRAAHEVFDEMSECDFSSFMWQAL
jgi:hypothetical protein